MKLVVPICPYGNWTTLTALMFALHKDFVVINHGYTDLPRRIFDGDKDAFLIHAKERYLEFDIRKELDVRHKFSIDNYEQRDPKYVYWKESGKIGNEFLLHYLYTGKLDYPKDIIYLFPLREYDKCKNTNFRGCHYVHYRFGFDEFYARILNLLLKLKERGYHVYIFEDFRKACREFDFYYYEWGEMIDKHWVVCDNNEIQQVQDNR